MKPVIAGLGVAAGCAAALIAGVAVEHAMHPAGIGASATIPEPSQLTTANRSNGTKAQPMTGDAMESKTFDEIMARANERDKAGDLVGFGRLLHGWIRTADTGQLSALLEPDRRSAILRREEDDGRLSWGLAAGALELALARWAELDRDATVAWAITRENVPDDERHMPDLAKGHVPWLKEEPEAALASIANANGAAGSSSLKHAREFLAARHPRLDFDWAVAFGVDPATFARMWLERGAPLVKIAEAALTAQSLSSSDREDVLRKLASGGRTLRENKWISDLRSLLRMIDDPALHDAIKDSAAKALAYSNHDPLGALRLADEFNIPFSNFAPGPARGGQLRTVMDHNPAGTVAFLNQMKNPENRKILLDNIFYGHGRNYALQARLDLYLQLPPEERPKLSKISQSVPYSAAKSPRATHQWLLDVLAQDLGESDGQALNRWAGSNALHLARQNSREVLEAIEQSPEGAFRDAMVKGAINGMVSHDLENALRLVDELSGDARTEIEATVMRQFINAEGADAGSAMLRDISDAAQRRELAMKLTRHIGIPAIDAVQIFEEFLGEDERAIESASTLVSQWTQVDPQAAANWVTNHAETENHPDRVRQLLRDWSTLDLTAATEYVRALPPGPAYDAGASQIIDLALESDPHTALEWSATLSDSNSRVENLRKAALAIERFATQPEEARNSILDLRLEAKEEARVLEDF